MHKLNLPHYDFNIVKDSPTKIFDFIRKKYVVLTPEEWVRQHFLKYLVTEKKYPQSLIFIEKTIVVNKIKRRCDAVVYNNEGNPMMIIEFKKPEVPIGQAVFNQIAHYNISMKLKYLMVSNGLQHYCSIIDFENHKYHFLDNIPEYSELVAML